MGCFWGRKPNDCTSTSSIFVRFSSKRAQITMTSRRAVSSIFASIQLNQSPRRLCGLCKPSVPTRSVALAGFGPVHPIRTIRSLVLVSAFQQLYPPIFIDLETLAGHLARRCNACNESKRWKVGKPALSQTKAEPITETKTKGKAKRKKKVESEGEEQEEDEGAAEAATKKKSSSKKKPKAPKTSSLASPSSEAKSSSLTTSAKLSESPTKRAAAAAFEAATKEILREKTLDVDMTSKEAEEPEDPLTESDEDVPMDPNRYKKVSLPTYHKAIDLLGQVSAGAEFGLNRTNFVRIGLICSVFV